MLVPVPLQPVSCHGEGRTRHTERKALTREHCPGTLNPKHLRCRTRTATASDVERPSEKLHRGICGRARQRLAFRLHC